MLAGYPYLQNEAFMHLSQLENAVLTSAILFSVSAMMLLPVKAWVNPWARALLANSQDVGRSDLAKETSTEGMLGF